MEFTNEEIKVIEKAEQSVKQTKRQLPFYMVLSLFFFMALLLLIFNFINFKEFSYIAIPIIFMVAIRPNLNKNPKYDDLVNILSSKKPKIEKSIDELTNAIK